MKKLLLLGAFVALFAACNDYETDEIALEEVAIVKSVTFEAETLEELYNKIGVKKPSSSSRNGGITYSTDNDQYNIDIDIVIENEVIEENNSNRVLLLGRNEVSSLVIREGNSGASSISFNNAYDYDRGYLFYRRVDDGGRSFKAVRFAFDRVENSYCGEYEFIRLNGELVIRSKCPDPIQRLRLNSQPLNERPNIIMIMTDDQGYGDAGFTGHPDILTPNLDRLAGEGITLDRFYAPAPSCAPSRAAFMIGRTHERTGVLSHLEGSLRFSEITLAEMVQEAGYTSGVFGKWHLGAMKQNEVNHMGNVHPYGPPVLHGFNTQFTTTGSIWEWSPTKYWTGENQFVAGDAFLRRGDSEVIADETLDFIDENQNDPFMALVWFHVPHTPLVTGGNIERPYSGSQYTEAQRKYYSLITDMDAQVGRIQAKLEELGMADNTIIMFSSDNGPAPSPSAGMYNPINDPGLTNGLRGRKGTLYEGGLRSPAFVKWPAHIGAGTRSTVPMSTMDYFPTIAHIIGVDISQYGVEYDGENVFDNLTNEFDYRRDDLWFRYGKFRSDPKAKALIRGNMKLIAPASYGEAIWELYDIELDPYETTDLAGDTRYASLMERMITDWKIKRTSVVKSLRSE